MEACFLLVNFRERNEALAWAAVNGQKHCVTTLITAAKETTAHKDISTIEFSLNSDLTAVRNWLRQKN